MFFQKPTYVRKMVFIHTGRGPILELLVPYLQGMTTVLIKWQDMKPTFEWMSEKKASNFCESPACKGLILAYLFQLVIGMFWLWTIQLQIPMLGHSYRE